MKNNKLLGTLLGDSYIGKNKDRYAFRSQHSPIQLDLLNDIAEELRTLYNRHVSVYYRAKRDIHELYLFDKTIVELRKKYYPNDKKNIINILNDVTNPELAVAYWLADDGCIHHATKRDTLLSPRLLLATCNETLETQQYICNWFTEKFNLTPSIIIQRSNIRNTQWYLVKFTVGDSYRLWMKVRHHILHLPSMRHKFRVVEQQFRLDAYRLKYDQECPAPNHGEDVRRTSEENNR